MMDVKTLQRNTLRYEFSDGMRDFQSALWLMIVGVGIWITCDVQSLWLAPMQQLRASVGDVLATIIIFGVEFALALAFTKGSLSLINGYIRRRWLWRETGMIVAKAWSISRFSVFVGFVIIMVTFWVGFVLAQRTGDGWSMLRALLLGTVFGMGYIYITLANRLQWVRYRVLALIGVVGSFGITLLPISFGLMGLLACMLWALLLIGNGVYALSQFLSMRQEMSDAA
jgi:hypothetical protein